MYESRRIAIVDYNTGIHQAREEGKKVVLEEGKKAEKIKVTQELLKIGMEIEQIEKVTQLTKEEIENIKKNIKRKRGS